MIYFICSLFSILSNIYLPTNFEASSKIIFFDNLRIPFNAIFADNEYICSCRKAKFSKNWAFDDQYLKIISLLESEPQFLVSAFDNLPFDKDVAEVPKKSSHFFQHVISELLELYPKKIVFY